MRAVFKHTDYQPQFKVSTRRAWYQRLTPLALFCVFLAGLGVVAIITIALNLWVSSGNGTHRLGVASAQTTAKTAQTSGAAAPAATVAPVAVIAANGQVKPATKPMIQPAPVAIAIQLPVAKPADVPASDASQAGQHNVQFATIPWAGQLSKTEKGGWMAPPEVVDQLVRDIKAYYKAMRDLELDDYLAQREVLMTSYFTGAQLDAARQAEAGRKTYELNRDGELTVAVLQFTEKGNRADVQIFTKGWVDDVYDFGTKKLLKANKKQIDQRLTVQMHYDAIEGRWKFEEILKKINLKES